MTPEDFSMMPAEQQAAYMQQWEQQQRQWEQWHQWQQYYGQQAGYGQDQQARYGHEQQGYGQEQSAGLDWQQQQAFAQQASSQEAWSQQPPGHYPPGQDGVQVCTCTSAAVLERAPLTTFMGNQAQCWLLSGSGICLACPYALLPHVTSCAAVGQPTAPVWGTRR